MFDDELMKKPQNNPWGFFVWIIILGSLVFMLFNDDWRGLIEKRTPVSVYLDQKQCQKTIESTSMYMCGKNQKYAEERAKTIIWPYKDEKQCNLDFGSCLKQPTGFWSPSSLGFAMVNHDTNYKSFPIYYSMKHKQYLLASGYPVVIGDNSLPYFESTKNYLVTRAGKLSQKICFDLSNGQKICNSRSEMIENQTKENLNMLMHSSLGVNE